MSQNNSSQDQDISELLIPELITPLNTPRQLKGGYTPMSVVKEEGGSKDYYTSTSQSYASNGSIDIDNDEFDEGDTDGANEALLNSMIGSLLDKDVREEVKDYCFSQRGIKRAYNDRDYYFHAAQYPSSSSSSSSSSTSSISTNNNNANETINTTFFGSNFSDDMEEASPLPGPRLPTGESAKKLRRTLDGPVPMKFIDDDDDDDDADNNDTNYSKLQATANRVLFPPPPPSPQGKDVEDDVTGLLLSLRQASVLSDRREHPQQQQSLVVEWDRRMAELAAWEPPAATVEEDYFGALLCNEERTRPGCHAMERQAIINADMRGILIDWLSEVADWYGLNEETLFLSVNYVDRFLCVRNVDKQAFQMLGLAAMFSAAKYEELDPPSSSDFAAMISQNTPNTQINRMEIILGAGIGFDYCVATPLAFLKALTNFDRPFLPSQDHFQQAFSCAIMTCELGLLCYELLQFKPSVVACASWALSRGSVGMKAWSQDLEKYTGYGVGDIEKCVRILDAWRRRVYQKKKSPILTRKVFRI